jgi:transposase
VLRHAFNWKRLSLAAALVYEPDGSDAHLVFELRPGAYNGETLIEFLTDLHELEPGRRLLLLWDGLPAHRSRCMTDWIKDQRAWLSVERLPGYAPELNPTEQVFGNLKSCELANLCRDTIADVQAVAEDGLDRIGPTPNSASPFCVTPVYNFDGTPPAITRSSFKTNSWPGSARPCGGAGGV